MRNHVDAEEEEERAEENAAEDEKDDDDDDAQGEQDEEEEEDAEQSPKGRKRARINDEGDSRPTDGGPKVEKRGQTLPRDVDGYVSLPCIGPDRIHSSSWGLYRHDEGSSPAL